MELNEVQIRFLEKKLQKLGTSKFRSSFGLKKKDKEYIVEKGIETIESHCIDFVNQRLAVSPTPNDGKQTPMRGHPVFIAQHACACCCRGCLEKWHHIPKNREMTEKEKRFVVALLMYWIEKNRI